jgi:hypothetical protein
MVLSYLEELKTSRDETIGVTESLISLTTSYKDIMGLLGKDTVGDEMYDIIEDVNEAASFGMKK